MSKSRARRRVDDGVPVDANDGDCDDVGLIDNNDGDHHDDHGNAVDEKDDDHKEDDESAQSDDTDDLLESIMGRRPSSQPVLTTTAKKRKGSSNGHDGPMSKKAGRATTPKGAPTTKATSKARTAIGRKKPPPTASTPAANRATSFTSTPVATISQEDIDDEIVIPGSRSHHHSDDEGDDGLGDGHEDTFEVSLPAHLFGGASTSSSAPAAECTLMIQVDPEDAALLDYEGVNGAIGRFEANDRGIVLDLKGCQYRGSILPGPTALVLGFVGSKPGEVNTGTTTCLRVEAITDEFATLAKTNDIMDQLNAVVEGEMEDRGFQLLHEENVNYAPSKHNNDGSNSDRQQFPMVQTSIKSSVNNANKNGDVSTGKGDTIKAKKRKPKKTSSTSSSKTSGVRQKR